MYTSATKFKDVQRVFVVSWDGPIQLSKCGQNTITGVSGKLKVSLTVTRNPLKLLTSYIRVPLNIWGIYPYPTRECKTLMKKVLGKIKTLHAGCSKAEPKIFALPQTPFPGVRDSQNLISWRWSLHLPTDPVGEDRCMQFRVIVVTDPQTHPQTDKTDYNTLCC